MNWLDIQFAQERHKDFLRDAETQRRIGQAKIGAKSPPPMLTKLRDVRLRQSRRLLKHANERY